MTCDEETQIRVAEVTKQRSLPTEGTFTFKLEVVRLGVDRLGRPVTSCVVAPVTAVDAARPSRTPGPRPRPNDRPTATSCSSDAPR